MKRWILVGAGLAMIAAALAVGWWVMQPTASRDVPTTTSVRRASIEETVLATGTIEASSLVTVGAEVSGRIESVDVELGQDVKAGDLIAQIDSLNQENAVRSAEAALAASRPSARSEASLAQARATSRAPRNCTTSSSCRTPTTSRRADRANRRRPARRPRRPDRAGGDQRQIRQLSLERTRIVAPSDGTVVAVAVQVGQSVNASNSTPTIVKIANLDEMLVKAEISEADVPLVKSGQRVYLTILGEPDNRITATLRAIEPAPSSILLDSSGASGSSSSAVYYNGLFDVPNPDHKLRISMTAQVTIILNAADDVLTVPASILSRRTPDGSYVVDVWNVAAGTAEPRVIEVGLNDQVNAEVLSGLAEGEQVVVSAGPGGTSGAGAGANPFSRGGGLLVGGGPMTGGPPPM